MTGWHSNQLNYQAAIGGTNRARTCDPLLVRQVLSQLSYSPISLSGAGEGDRTLTAGLEGRNSTIELHPHALFLVEDGGFEPPKALLTDLQSAPFGRSGNPPKDFGAGDRNRTYNLLITSQLLYR